MREFKSKHYIRQGFVLQFVFPTFFYGNLTKTVWTVTNRRTKYKHIGLKATELINNDTISSLIDWTRLSICYNQS